MAKKKTKQIDVELRAFKDVFAQAHKELGSLDYTFQVRRGEIKRTVIAEVFNGTDFDE